MASPIEIVFAISPIALSALGPEGFTQFLSGLEKAWNFKKRIRLEGIELERKTYEEELARDQARDRYRDYRRAGFELQDGSARFPDDWQWPSDK
jgi:DNA polymerase IIIc chi subunit